MEPFTDASHADWDKADSDRVYRITRWGGGYYGINDDGHITVKPRSDQSAEVDLRLLVDELRQRRIRFPILIRFMDILSDRIKALADCFQRARKTFDFSGEYHPVFPIKVNQQKQVVSAMIRSGGTYRMGLEVGSKPELMAVLALSPNDDSLIICNGYKDTEFIRTALLARQMGSNVILVVEQLAELHTIISVAGDLNVVPSIGVRIKLNTRSEGQWADTAGDCSKFGLRVDEVVTVTDILSDHNMLHAFNLIHFHIGSQISNIQNIKLAMTEVSRVYASMRKMGIEIRYVDIGGGLGIDYDGTSSRNAFSVNYSMQEYADDVVYSLKHVCELENLTCPDIITESGRALTAHFSVLVTDVVDRSSPVDSAIPEVSTTSSEQLKDLLTLHDELKAENCREHYQDALYIRKESINLFNMGYMALDERSQIECAFWHTMNKVNRIRRSEHLTYHEFDTLDKLLACTYTLNFSLFQSVPDSWAIKQVFPIVPIQRLNEAPEIYCTIADITCDSDGRVCRYIGGDEVSDILRLHEISNDEAYYVGFFLVGAYQEILGDLHNLFGEINAVHVELDENNAYRIAHRIKGDSISEILEYVEYNAKELIEQMRSKLESCVDNNGVSVAEAARFLAYFERALHGYTYLGD